jgi:hypothetical protein
MAGWPWIAGGRFVSDDSKEAEQLRAAIASLKQQIEDREAIAPPTKHLVMGPVNRQGPLGMWLTPVTLSIPGLKSAKRVVRGLKPR